MTAQREPYVRVYYSIIDDPKFEGMKLDVKGAWVDLLITADSMYPSVAPIPRWLTKRILDDLVTRGIVEMVGTDHYRIHGLHAERERRSSVGKAGADARWNADAMRSHSDGNAPPKHNALHSKPSHSTPSNSTPLHSGGRDAVGAYYDLKGGQVSQGAIDMLEEMVRDFGDEDVIAMLGIEAKRSRIDREFLSRVKGALVVDASRRAREGERRSQSVAIEEQRALEERLANASPEEQRRAAEVRDSIGAFIRGIGS